MHKFCLNPLRKIVQSSVNLRYFPQFQYLQSNNHRSISILTHHDQIQNNQLSKSQILNNSNSSILTNTPIVDPTLLYREPRMLDCILVRHGESEGNIAYNKSFLGDHSLYSGAFLKRHSSLWRLTDRGREQAMIAGSWLRENLQWSQDEDLFHRYYVSEYIRAMETAGLMGMPGANWFVEVQLRERDWGQFDILSQKERVVRFSEETKRRDRDSLFYAPPGGESLVHVLSRVDGILNNFNRQAANQRCLIVSHGEVMWAFRLRFERLSQLTYREMEAAPTSLEKIHNAQILHYSRKNPFTGEISPIFKWKRSVCPWDLSKSRNVWEEIIRVQHTNESLLQHANRIKRIYAHDNPFNKNVTNTNTSTDGSSPAVNNAIVPQSPLIANPVTNASPPSENITNNNSSNNNNNNNNNNSTNSNNNNNNSSTNGSNNGTKTETVISNSSQSLATNNMSQLQSEPWNNLSEPSTSNDNSVLKRSVSTSTSTSDLPTSSQQSTEAMRLPKFSNATATNNNTENSNNNNQTNNNSASKLSIANPFLKTHPSVLVLTKTPRYEHEKQSLGLRGEDLHSELSRLGFVSDRLVQSYVRHMEGLSQLTSALQQHGMKVTVKQVDQCVADDLKGVDLVISAGGDGTMLKSASLLGRNPGDFLKSNNKDNNNNVTKTDKTIQTDDIENHFIDPSSANIPLIGVNTDPQHSAGILCAFSVEGPHTCERVLEHIHRGNFVFKTKTRLSVQLIDKSGAITVIPQLALNDILIAEKDPGRPFVYELTVDDQPSEIQRSSGLLISTGTGSTAWMSSAASIHPDQVTRILQDIGIKHISAAEAKHIAERVNMDMIYDSESLDLEYYVREQLLSGIVSSKSRYQYRHGFARKLMIRSLGWNANMFFDGLSTYSLPKGTIAQISIGIEPQTKLTVLSLSGAGEPFSRQ